MRNINDDNHVSNDETDFCDCCGGEFDHRDLLKVYKEQPITVPGATVQVSKDAMVRVCEDCQGEMEGELNLDFTGDVLDPQTWDKLAEMCKKNHILAFIPASEQIQTEYDVREFIDALTKFLVWHPENDFAEYVGGEGERIFSDDDAGRLNECMRKAQEVCEKLSKGVDIEFYELSFQALAKHNEAMADAMGRDHKTGLSLPGHEAEAEQIRQQLKAKSAKSGNLVDVQPAISVAQKVFEALERAKAYLEPMEDVNEEVTAIVAQANEALEAYRTAVQS